MTVLLWVLICHEEQTLVIYIFIILRTICWSLTLEGRLVQVSHDEA